MSGGTPFRIGVDIGGTFTDTTIVADDGWMVVHKTPSTPRAFEEGVLRGISEGLARAGLDPAGCTTFVHGSTVAVNTVIQRRGARVGVLLTKGFEDLLELGRTKMPDPFSLYTNRPLPLSRRNWVRGIRERVDARGRVLVPIDAESVVAAARELLELGAQVLTVALLNAYRNPAHEQRAREMILSYFPDADVVLSTDVWPQIREYERVSVAVMNSYIGPEVKRYLKALEHEQKRIGVAGALYMTGSNGGILPLGHAAARPIVALTGVCRGGIVGA